MKTQTINGVLCAIETDENGFFDVHIADGQTLNQQWIVRGEVTREQAVETAGACIEHLKKGDLLFHHDPEGRIMTYTLPQEIKDEIARVVAEYRKGEEWKG